LGGRTGPAKILAYLAADADKISIDHLVDHVLERGTCMPTEFRVGLAGIAQQEINLAGRKNSGLMTDVIIRLQPDNARTRSGTCRATVVVRPGCNNVIVRLVLLKISHIAST